MIPTGWRAALAWMVVALAAEAASTAEPSLVQFDFESGDLQGWEVVEGDLGKLLGNRAHEFHHPVAYTKQGTYYLTTLERADGDQPDDRYTGVVESPVFILAGRSASLRVGGGSHPTTYVALCLEDGQEVLRASGRNSQTMQPVTWDTSAWVGRRMFLRLVDRHQGGWGHVTFDDFATEGRIDAEGNRMRAAERQARRRQEIVAGQRQAVESLVRIVGDRLPDAAALLARLERAEGAELEALRREILAASQPTAGRPLLLVVRPQYRPDHHNSATMFQTGEINTASFEGGAALKTIDLATGQVKTLLEVPQGIVRDPDVRFDGRRILFSLRRDRTDDYHLYEMNADGSDLRQLTFGAGLSDIDPIYLPDGRILFTSTREPKYCMCNRHIMGNLYTMNADGTGLQQIGHSTLHEGHAALLPDGRVLYDRWEYVDRNFGDAQGVWTVNPDGTNHAVYWGNNTNSPGAVLDARPVPGTELFLATFSSCHDRPWGSLALVDRRLALDGRSAVLQTWPAEAIELVGQGNYDAFTRVRPKYEDPYPLSDRLFLCSRMTGQAEAMGIYLIDRHGNEVLLHAEEPGCFDPMPLGPRPRPPAIPERIDLAAEQGYFFVENVYLGTGMERVEPGSVRRLRVVESPEKRFWTGPAWDGGTGQQAPGMAWDDFNNKRILGEVPVEADGSAYFAVPADTFVYFQLLDEQGRMVQSMRSGTIVRPGETTGCVGCHEERRSAPPPKRLAAAWLRGPQPLEPWYGPARLFSYTAEVQPVFDRHCVACHDYGQDAGEKLNLAGDLGLVFNTSYVELRSKGYVRVVGAGPFAVQAPKSWGSHASPLARILLEGHGQPEIDAQVHLDRQSLQRVLTWIDINAPYYPDYAAGALRDRPFGRSPLDASELQRLGELTGVALADRKNIAQVNFTRPERSPCLARLADVDSADYQEALALIRQGRERLLAAPRPDMSGFCHVDPVEMRQEAKYQERLADELRRRGMTAADLPAPPP